MLSEQDSGSYRVQKKEKDKKKQKPAIGSKDQPSVKIILNKIYKNYER